MGSSVHWACTVPSVFIWTGPKCEPIPFCCDIVANECEKMVTEWWTAKINFTGAQKKILARLEENKLPRGTGTKRIVEGCSGGNEIKNVYFITAALISWKKINKK